MVNYYIKQKRFMQITINFWAMIYILSSTTRKALKNTFQATTFKVEDIQELFNDLHRNLRTFQGKMEFKDFSRLCEPWIYPPPLPMDNLNSLTIKLKNNMENRPIWLTQCCTQFRSPGDKILCVLYLHYNVAFTFKWYGNSWKKTFYFQRVWIGYNIEQAA